jgi:hypothetical protein
MPSDQIRGPVNVRSKTQTRRGVRSVGSSVPHAGLVPNCFTSPQWAASLTLTARARSLNQAMPIGISPVGDKAPSYRAVPIEERRIEPTLSLHDHTPAQALAASGVEPRHEPFRTTRSGSHPSGGVVLRALPAHAR